MRIVEARDFPAEIITDDEMEETLEYLMGILKTSGRECLMVNFNKATGKVTILTEEGGRAVLDLEG